MRAKAIPWTAADEFLLRQLYPMMPRRKLSGLFGERSVPAICSRAKVLGLKKARERKIWTPADDATLRRLWPNIPTRKIAQIIGCTQPMAERRGHRLGLAKSPDYIERFCRIQPGTAPANKGKPGPPSPFRGMKMPAGYVRGRMRETLFRAGEAPHNTMPLWSFRINTEGYLLLKTGKPGPKPNNGWEYVHRLIWEQANGPLPHWTKGRLWWKDGDHANSALSNLELVKGSDHVARTAVWTLPKPLALAIQLKGALKRRIRRMEREANAQEHDGRSAQSPVRDDRSAAG